LFFFIYISSYSVPREEIQAPELHGDGEF
jgi:hypothetical protein